MFAKLRFLDKLFMLWMRKPDMSFQDFIAPALNTMEARGDEDVIDFLTTYYH